MSEIYFSEKLNDKPDWVYDAMTTEGEHITKFPQHDNLELIDEIDLYEDPVKLESILAIQSLAMGSLRHAARVKLRGGRYNRRHGFSIVAESNPSLEAYDGETEEYMSYRIGKNGFSDWSMRVRFRNNERVEEKATTSYLEDYYFVWRRSKEITTASLDSHTLYSDGYTSLDDFNSKRQLTNGGVVDLHARMYQHVEKSGAWPEGGFMKPSRLHFSQFEQDDERA